MTAGAWRTIREALATKIDASSGMATAGLRRALAKVDEPLSMMPEARVLQPSYTFLAGTANEEQYLLDIPVEIVCGIPAGRWRSNQEASDIARAAQVESWDSVKLDVAISLLEVVDCRLLSATDGLTEYDRERTDDGRPMYDGYRLLYQVQVRESITRTA